MSGGASEQTIEWLLSSSDPSVRYLTLVDVIDEPARAEDDVRSAKEQIVNGDRVRALLDGQRSDGGFGDEPYIKWSGVFWRLLALTELAVPASYERLAPAIDHVLAWLTSEPLSETVNGLPRIHATIPGYAVACSSLLGRASDPRVKVLIDVLLDTQWPEGGWNCDETPTASCSSVHESLGTLWGLIEYAKVTGDVAVSRAADRATESSSNGASSESGRRGRSSIPSGYDSTTRPIGTTTSCRRS